MILLCLLQSVFAIENEVENDLTLSKFDELDLRLNADFKMGSLSFADEDYLIELASDMTLEERQELFDSHKKTSGKYVALNLINGGLGIGSFVQKDIFSGILCAALNQVGTYICDLSLTAFININFITLFSQFYNFEVRDSMMNVDAVILTGFMVGQGLILASILYGTNRPVKVANTYNKKLARILGVSDAAVSLAPVFTTEATAKGVALAMEIRF